MLYGDGAGGRDASSVAVESGCAAGITMAAGLGAGADAGTCWLVRVAGICGGIAGAFSIRSECFSTGALGAGVIGLAPLPGA